MRAIDMPPATRLLYGGGPWFAPRTRLPGYEVWARAVAPASATNRAGDGQPTIVRYAYGRGSVVLFAYHPEILIGSDTDGVELAVPYDESAIVWDTGELSLEDIHRDGWNLVHAALQVAAGAAPTPLPEPPR